LANVDHQLVESSPMVVVESLLLMLAELDYPSKSKP
jgi:hypothetical protein